MLQQGVGRGRVPVVGSLKEFQDKYQLQLVTWSIQGT